ncbi:hypothetical protein JCM11641_004021, partial [Rhodosporidiobolus odoratus]
QPRASVGYNSVVKNGPAPVEVRGQSVRDDVAASMKPVEAGRSRRSVRNLIDRATYISTPNKVLLDADEDELLAIYGKEMAAGPDPARAQELHQNVLDIITARAKREQEYHSRKEAEKELAAQADESVSTSSVGSVDFDDGLDDLRAKRKADQRQRFKTAGGSGLHPPPKGPVDEMYDSPSSSSSSSGESDTEDGDRAAAKRYLLKKELRKLQREKEKNRKEKRSRRGAGPPDDDSSDDSSSDDGKRSRKEKRSQRKNKKRRERARSGGETDGDEDERRPRARPSIKVPPPAEKYSGNDPSARILARFSRGLRTYLLASRVDPDSLDAAGHISACLSSRAAEAFSHVVLRDVNEVFRPNQGHRASPWSFSDIIGLFKERFVSITSVRDAQRQFRELRQWKKNGTYIPVNDLAMKLEELGEEKYEVTEFELKRTFIDALEPNIATKVFPMFAGDFESRKVSYQMIVAEAIVQEQVWMQEMAAKDARYRGSALSNYEAFSSTGIQSRLIAERGKKGVQVASMKTNESHRRSNPSNSNLSRSGRYRRNPAPKKQNKKPFKPRTEAEEKLYQDRK